MSKRLTIRVLLSPGLALSLFTFSAPSINAQTFVHDGFLSGSKSFDGEYVAGETLVSRDPAALGALGPWLGNVGNTDNIKSVAAGLDYLDPLYLPETGGSAQFIPDGAGDQGRIGRELVAPVTASSSGELYFSFLMQTDTTIPAAYRAFEFHLDDKLGPFSFSDVPQRKFQIGFHSGDFDSSTNFGFNATGSGGSGANALSVNNSGVNLFVGKLFLSADAGEDSVTVWQNPDLSMGVDPENGVTETGLDFEFTHFTFAKFGENSVTVSWDEVRFGETFADVTTGSAAVPEPRR